MLLSLGRKCTSVLLSLLGGGLNQVLKGQIGCKRDLIPSLHTQASKDSNLIACPPSSPKGSTWDKKLVLRQPAYYQAEE